MASPIVIKVGGHEIEDADFLLELADIIRNRNQPVVIVHGGGREISEMQQRLGIKPIYIDGVRVTDRESLDVVTMMLCGLVNKRVVRVLVQAGIDAIGMSGADRGLIRAVKMPHETVDMGFTGEVESVRGDVLLDMLNEGLVPVVAPICYGDNNLFNVNADHAAGAIASAIQAEKLVFLTNVEGVLQDGEVIAELSAAEAAHLIESGVISGGMIPKVETALHALISGVSSTVITNLKGLRSQGGTIFVQG